ncbi:hypothetical protein [Aquirufa antheringensis]|uniref:hypothetical protein n=1 Tax=Aquirufa antheringensis TaxID=2516559 RepID=UPI0022A8AD03|nr:hypothetical protein [Aquirufa antheringensis]MCZ2487193.1 hypothetical protein [Aquirufa antheringensis]
MIRIIFLFLFISTGLFAQTGIGTTTPNASAKLDVYSTNKGFLPPRVTLTSTTDASTIASPAEGLLVYNLGSVGLQAGYYFWNGANWATIATATSAGNGVAAMDMVKLYAKKFVDYNTGIVSPNGQSFKVPISGRYIFDFSSTGFASNVPFSVYFQIRNTSNGIIGADTVITANNYQHVEFNGKVEVNLLANTNYNAYVSFPSGLRDANDYDRVYYKLVAGNLPVTGQSVDYGIARYTGADGASLSANAIVPFDATAAGNLPWSGNKFTLKANKTYELESYLAVWHGSAGVAGVFQIYNYTNSSVLASGLYISINGSGGYNVNGNGPMRCVITPTSDIEVGVRISTAYGGWPGIVGSTSTIGASGAANQSYLLVKQIGSSAIVNPWVLSGSDSYNTTGKVGIGTNSPTSTLDVTGNINVTGKINLTDPSGNVVTKAAGFVGRGTDITLGNLKVRFAASGNMSLQVSTITGTYSVYGSGVYMSSGVAGSNAGNLTINTSPAYLKSSLNFLGAGDTDTWLIMDTSALMGWRISMIVGPAYVNNFISIERLL